MSRLRLAGGRVYDPAHGIDGAVRDICLDDGRIVADLPPDAPTLDVTGLVVMPGGIDIHAHIASGSTNLARRLLPEEHAADPEAAPPFAAGRSGTGGTTPSTFTTGYRYARMGYTTVFDAAVAPLMARHSHAEMQDTPILDTGFYVLMGNDDYLLAELAAGRTRWVKDYAAWLLARTGGYAIKIVDAGGVEQWKAGVKELIDLDDPCGPNGLTPRKVMLALAEAADALALPHPIHLHCNRIGQPGNSATTLRTLEALDGHRAHVTHLQFHCYGGERGKGWRSEARAIIDHINAHPSLSFDVGQVVFGPATTLSGDCPAQYLLHRAADRKWLNVDLELEGGCGIIPYAYKQSAAVAALQWAIGLELFLLAADPWRIVLTTDHPNGGLFQAYPHIIRLLTDRAFRAEALKAVNPKWLQGSALLDGLDREYTLGEICIITRAGPARLLGLAGKGHLGPGADADITVYRPQDDAAAMFAAPVHVLKGGVPVVRDGALVASVAGRRLSVAPAYDEAVVAEVRRFHERFGSVSFENFASVA
ncbi:MAG: formylmethanofuran dehydrogenase subunit A [Gemmatimonadales bacterium]|nr:formylmethanofuran dehydrogenase subunit A [Gemmatimonadales bacterium]